MSRQGAGWSFALVAGAMVACGGNQNQASTEAMACQPVEGTLPADLDAGSWAGTYQVTLVATRGDSTGKSTTGQMRLMPQEESLKETDGAMMPLIGTMEVDLAAVNAVQMGALDSKDPSAPGVLVLQRPYEKETGEAATEVTIRLGAEANTRGVVRFDGGFTAFYVLQAGSAGFAGNWASGVKGPESGGHFCALADSEG